MCIIGQLLICLCREKEMENGTSREILEAVKTLNVGEKIGKLVILSGS